MIDVLLIIGAVLLLLGGILGAVLPVLPGPPLSFVGFLLIHLTSKAHFSTRLIIVFAIITILVTVADLVLPSWATGRTGGSKMGMYGAAIGLVAGMFIFPPIGIILGPFFGAFIAELMNKRTSDVAFRAAIGSFIGLLTGTIMKLIFSLIITWYALKPLLCSIG